MNGHHEDGLFLLLSNDQIKNLFDFQSFPPFSFFFFHGVKVGIELVRHTKDILTRYYGVFLCIKVTFF